MNSQPDGAQEFSIQLGERTTAGLCWGPPSDPLIVAVHGWMDNAASFFRLGPELSARGYRLLAIDLAGHGRSDWRAAESDYSILNYVRDLRELVEQLDKEWICLLGHSLGAGVCSLYAATWPEQLNKLVLIENLGPQPEEGVGLTEVLRSEARTRQPVTGSIRDWETWVRSRMQSGFEVDRTAAEQLMRRQLTERSEGWLRHTDPRVFAPTLRLTETQIRDALAQIQADTLLITGNEGPNLPLTQARSDCVSQLSHIRVDGGHHLHLEQQLVPKLAEKIHQFLSS